MTKMTRHMSRLRLCLDHTLKMAHTMTATSTTPNAMFVIYAHSGLFCRKKCRFQEQFNFKSKVPIFITHMQSLYIRF